jgi:hypothetical protein
MINRAPPGVDPRRVGRLPRRLERCATLMRAPSDVLCAIGQHDYASQTPAAHSKPRSSLLERAL